MPFNTNSGYSLTFDSNNLAAIVPIPAGADTDIFSANGIPNGVYLYIATFLCQATGGASIKVSIELQTGGGNVAVIGGQQSTSVWIVNAQQTLAVMTSVVRLTGGSPGNYSFPKWTAWAAGNTAQVNTQSTQYPFNASGYTALKLTS